MPQRDKIQLRQNKYINCNNYNSNKKKEKLKNYEHRYTYFHNL